MDDAAGPAVRRPGPGGVPVLAPPLVGPALLDQLWTDLVFLHWPVEPASVARFFPPGTRPDELDGVTYVGLVPFRMREAGPGRDHPVPFFGSFLEVNVRLYSVDDEGRHGVLFRTLDADRAAVVLGARFGMRLPYTYASITADPPVIGPGSSLPEGQRRRYTVIRRLPLPRVTTEIAVQVGPPVEPTPEEVFLTARWGLHFAFGRRTVWIPNEHESWPLHGAELVDLRDELVAAAGVVPSGPMLRPLWTPGVHTYFGRPVLL